MTDLYIQKLDPTTVDRLKDRAARRGVSIEEEAREILQQALAPTERLGKLALRLFGTEHGIELDTPKREQAQPLDLSR
ncbi:hypothetical protein L6R29_03530 [Myxococcota bacterium]|nr:hypothetical protein [Myxococcota bacterium]